CLRPFTSLTALTFHCLLCNIFPSSINADGDPLIVLQIIANHHMQSISFASGGDPDTTDYVAYVAKDPVNQRACHILECGEGHAQDVISTIGQAFELRFKQYLKNPPKLITPHDRMSNLEGSAWDEEEEDAEEHQYYNSIPGKETPSTASEVTCITMAVQHRLSHHCLSHGSATASFVSPLYFILILRSLVDVGLQIHFFFHEYVILLLPNRPPREKELRAESWFHGCLSRREAEGRLCKDGDFLVRESTTTHGQFVLTGMQNQQVKHLLLVDPEGVVRTKDRRFDSVSHLIEYHRDNQLPIISAGSELCLKQPVNRLA
uniref:SHC adaptor protein 1 n=1 Tax=Eptatretus burgeri TaxID=7764 RepID=A0A8C4WTU2_EPTBU